MIFFSFRLLLSSSLFKLAAESRALELTPAPIDPPLYFFRIWINNLQVCGIIQGEQDDSSYVGLGGG
jgi:hypothetical protein